MLNNWWVNSLSYFKVQYNLFFFKFFLFLNNIYNMNFMVFDIGYFDFNSFEGSFHDRDHIHMASRPERLVGYFDGSVTPPREQSPTTPDSLPPRLSPRSSQLVLYDSNVAARNSFEAGVIDRIRSMGNTPSFEETINRAAIEDPNSTLPFINRSSIAWRNIPSDLGARVVSQLIDGGSS